MLKSGYPCPRISARAGDDKIECLLIKMDIVVVSQLDWIMLPISCKRFWMATTDPVGLLSHA